MCCFHVRYVQELTSYYLLVPEYRQDLQDFQKMQGTRLNRSDDDYFCEVRHFNRLKFILK